VGLATDAAKNSKALLEKVNANILGVIMNKIPDNEGGYYKYHYNSYYQSFYEDEVAVTRDKRRRKGK